MEAHRDMCDRNHTGSSGSMEGAKILWKWSVDVAAFRYTSLVADGDAAVIKLVNAIDPYHSDSGQGGMHQPRHKAYVQGPGESGERWKC